MKSKIKNPKLILATLLLSAFVSAQVQTLSKVPELYIRTGVNILFQSPEPIQFVDISTAKIIGDMPAENLVRIKAADFSTPENAGFSTKKDTLKTLRETPAKYFTGEELGIITIVGQSFMAQYKLLYSEYENGRIASTVQIEPKDMQLFEYPENDLSNAQLQKFCLNLISKNARNPIRTEKALKLSAELNNVYVVDNYIFLDLTFKNKTNLWYAIDRIKFTIDDKKVYKSTNVQSIDLEPVYQLFDQKSFRKSYRNIYVFKKFTFPDNKVLTVRMIEDQISGRTIDLPIKYKDILKADTF